MTLNSKKKRSVIYRCGWCGQPVQENGQLLPDIKNTFDCFKYLEENAEANVKIASGRCCIRVYQ